LSTAGVRHALKGGIRAAYRLLKWILPNRVRREIEAYRRFRRAGTPAVKPNRPRPARKAATGGPYWERREPKGISRRPVRVGFVGAGSYAQHHLKVLGDLESVSVTSLLTTGSPRGQETAARYGIPFLTHDRRQFLARDDIDCFVVASSAQSMYGIAFDCLATGKPVLMEKPPGITSAETASLARQAEAHDTFGMVGMNRRFYSVIEHGLAQLALFGPIRGAMLEAPLGITAERQSQRLSQWDYDHFYVRNAIHAVDLLRYVLGDPMAVHSLSWPNIEYQNSAASYAAILQFKNGMVASLVDLWDTPQRWRFKVVAEGGWIEFEPLENGWYLTESMAKVALRADSVDSDYRAGLYAQDLHFIDAVRRGVRPARPACLLHDAHQTMVLIDQILASSISQPQELVVEQAIAAF
jgi:predicted dehydrogenase